jgi:formamidopyrimidine-DNA glycosylase
MPELPDVEIARRGLQRRLKGARITDARLEDAYIARPTAPKTFAATLRGRIVAAIERRGKWLKLVFDDGGLLFSHLGMTGSWVYVAVSAPAARFERARIDFTKNGRAASARYVDSRRFGRLVATKRDLPEWTELGPDPLDDGIDVDALGETLAAGRRSVKEILMDQTVLAGVGNILATEALWLARVDPRAKGNTITAAQVRGITRALKKTIEEEIAERTSRTYAEGGGTFHVYGRAGEPCPRDGTTIESVTLGGRTTAFCPHCQGDGG